MKFKLIIATLLAAAVSSQAAQNKIDFNRDIRPILSDTCFTCHGPDEAKRKSKLRLDERDSALKPAKSGAKAIVPGKSVESELLKRITSKDDDERMPPGVGKKLTPEQVELFKQWIDQGAEFQGHWAFQTPKRPELPETKNAAWVRNPIDNFVLARLEKEGLKPTTEASKYALLRRASLDLTGLPPTPAEVDAYLADTSPDAYEKQVDRLLASPRYGETMALKWLDFARYADSNGYQADGSRDMWHWRDWVIDAYNKNMPFDQFTVEQLAGDMLPNATRSQIIATGFNRNHRLTNEGGSIAEEWRIETVIDRVETTGQTWLALTMNCCRCHDHKYDPITQREFYSMFAFFNNVPESGMCGKDGTNSAPLLSAPTAAQAADLARLEKEAAVAQAKVTAAQKDIPKLAAAWEKGFLETLKKTTTAWNDVELKDVKSQGGATFTRQADGSWLASGKNPPNDTYIASGPIAAGECSGLRIEVLPDASLPNQSLGRFTNGNFVLTGVEAEITAPGLATPIEIEFVKAATDYEQAGYEVKFIVENKPKKGKGAKDKKGWAVNGNEPEKRVPRKAMFLAAAPVAIPANATITVKLKHELIAGHNIGRFRLSTSSLPPALVKLTGENVPASLRAALEKEAAKRTPAQRTEIEKFFRENTDNPVKHAEMDAAKIKKSIDDLNEKISTTMVMKEMDKPRDAFLLIRGQYDKPGDKVVAALPASLPQMPAGAPMNRLGLAKWIVDPSNPLTARVQVNRFWEKFFGYGLVKSTENFGSQADWPSHPELLDWLATEFIRVGWDMKAFQKLIVTSATYRQSSSVTPALIEKDPENRLFARGPRFRLQAEIIRDQALFAAGLLVETSGGPSVRPYMPDRVWDETSAYGNLRNYKHDTGDGLYRRSMYTIWKRTCAPPQMLIFDASGRETCTIKRSRTNTPLQALTLLNEMTYVEASRSLAERMIKEGGATPADRVTLGFRRAIGRAPTDAESKVLLTGLQKRLEKYKSETDSAKKLIAIGETKADPKLDPVELAAYTMTANVILNLDEMVTRE
ncbi:MAG: PSD1 and planctomycete cytochrome C domain-containing protein [Planctomycetota bacterium]